MGSKNRSAARFRICSGHRSDSRAGGSGGWKAAGTNEERKRRAGVHFPGRHLLLASCRSGTRFSGGARRASSSLVPRLAPRGSPGRQEWRVESGGDERRAEKKGGGSFPRQASSPRLMQIGYSVQRGARRASSSLVPRLAPRGFPVRRGWRGGERQGWRVSAVRKGGGCAGCEKGHGRGRVTFPPLGSVLTSHRSDSRSGTKWWGAASLPRVDQVLGSAGGEARFLVSCPPPRAAWIPGPAGMAGRGAAGMAGQRGAKRRGLRGVRKRARAGQGHLSPVG